MRFRAGAGPDLPAEAGRTVEPDGLPADLGPPWRAVPAGHRVRRRGQAVQAGCARLARSRQFGRHLAGPRPPAVVDVTGGSGFRSRCGRRAGARLREGGAGSGVRFRHHAAVPSRSRGPMWGSRGRRLLRCRRARCSRCLSCYARGRLRLGWRPDVLVFGDARPVRTSGGGRAAADAPAGRRRAGDRCATACGWPLSRGREERGHPFRGPDGQALRRAAGFAGIVAVRGIRLLREAGSRPPTPEMLSDTTDTTPRPREPCGAKSRWWCRRY
ncbi:hypothetical protein A4R44_03807 [Amycolatopsis sp. M39]|uniref:Uncharacterized protein n=1 Tax=Amycolatopsis rubida TaxID=112413 RepID=A0A1I5LLP2_9PSEU|nr:hypothetical protein A4R44_03807 [Amycolatopsis sp. M39]SFO98309.1 hypothetical protein SAMN05421854_103635 [Amycolatopsis rubida]